MKKTFIIIFFIYKLNLKFLIYFQFYLFFPYYCFSQFVDITVEMLFFFHLYSYYGNILVQNVVDYFYAMSFIPFVRSLSFCLCYFLGYCDFLSATSINNPEMANCSWRCCYFSLFIRIIPERSLSSVITNSNVKISENVEKIW